MIARSGNSSLVAYAPHLERQRLKSSKSSQVVDEIRATTIFEMAIVHHLDF